MSSPWTPCVVALCVLSAGCTHDEKTSGRKILSAPVPAGEGKPMAPVAVTAELGATGAHLTLTFEAACEACVVSVDGVDGLGATAASSALGARGWKAGDSSSLDVDLRGTGTLVVSVRGTFNGAPQARVVSFAVGEVKLDRSGTRVQPDNGPGMKTAAPPAR